MAKIAEGAYFAKQYAGRISVQGTSGLYFTQYQNNPQPPWPPTGPLRVPPLPKRHWLPYMKWLEYQKLNKETKMWHKHPAKPSGYPCDDPAHCPVCKEYHLWYIMQKSNKEVKMSEDDYTDDYEEMTLFEVNTIYGEDRNNAVVEREHVVAETAQRALLQCKTIPEDWDMDYVTREATSICTVRVKRKPREILAKK